MNKTSNEYDETFFLWYTNISSLLKACDQKHLKKTAPEKNILNGSASLNLQMGIFVFSLFCDFEAMCL